MFAKLHVTGIRMTNIANLWYENAPASVPVEDTGHLAQKMYSHPPVTASHLSSRWVISGQTGELVIQWDEA